MFRLLHYIEKGRHEVLVPVCLDSGFKVRPHNMLQDSFAISAPSAGGSEMA